MTKQWRNSPILKKVGSYAIFIGAPQSSAISSPGLLIASASGYAPNSRQLNIMLNFNYLIVAI